MLTQIKALDSAGEYEPFKKSARVQNRYARELRKVAREVGRIITTYPPLDVSKLPQMRRILATYSEILTPWATETAARVVADLDQQDVMAWAKHSRTMSRALRQEIVGAPIGGTLRAFLAEQVRLITSLPTEAGERVHELTLEGIANATRASEIAKEIGASGEVTASRATLIARTEVARTASALTMTRAQHVGSEGYIWRTSEDSDVRPSHREMNGKYVAWSTPPKLSDGTVTHAGMIYNCRCYPEPVIGDEVERR